MNIWLLVHVYTRPSQLFPGSFFWGQCFVGVGADTKLDVLQEAIRLLMDPDYKASKKARDIVYQVLVACRKGISSKSPDDFHRQYEFRVMQVMHP